MAHCLLNAGFKAYLIENFGYEKVILPNRLVAAVGYGVGAAGQNSAVLLA